MADSVALLVAANLATIGGHVAEMISIFVYPVIGYFWTRRRRRSPSMDFNAGDSTIPMAPEELNPVDILAGCIARLMAILLALEGLSSDEGMVRLHHGQERFDELMEEHRNLQQAVSRLMKEARSTMPDHAVVRRRASDISQCIRLLELEGEMLSVEIYQMRIVEGRNGSTARPSPVREIDLEQGIHDARPLTSDVPGAPRLKGKKTERLVEQPIDQQSEDTNVGLVGVQVGADWESDIDEIPQDFKLEKRTRSSFSPKESLARRGRI